jgi:phosphoribosylformylglycinamidine synthase I
MTLGVIAFPDFDCGKSMFEALKKTLKVPVKEISHDEKAIEGVQAIFITGGTQWIDYIGNENAEKASPIILAIKQFAMSGGYIFGTGEGFRFLCLNKLLPGSFALNKNGLFIHKNVHIKVDNAQTALTTLVDKTGCLKLPLATLYGKYTASDVELTNMRQNGQILYRFCDDSSRVSDKINFTGSVDNVAAICNDNKNIFGILPSPELACDDRLGNTDGRYIFESIIAWTR